MNELDKKIFEMVSGIPFNKAIRFGENSDGFTFEDYFSGEIELTKKLSQFFLEKIKELESKLSQLQAKAWHEGYSALWNWIEEEEFRRKNLLPYINKPTNPYLESKLAEQSEGQDGLWKEAFELFYEHNAKELKSKFKITRV